MPCETWLKPSTGVCGEGGGEAVVYKTGPDVRKRTLECFRRSSILTNFAITEIVCSPWSNISINEEDWSKSTDGSKLSTCLKSGICHENALARYSKAGWRLHAEEKSAQPVSICMSTTETALQTDILCAVNRGRVVVLVMLDFDHNLRYHWPRNSAV